jgi:hypothetical protein
MKLLSEILVLRDCKYQMMKKNLKKRVKKPQVCLLKRKRNKIKKLLIQIVKIQTMIKRKKMKCKMPKIQILFESLNNPINFKVE